MTGKKQELSERIQREFEICEKHLSRIDEALEALEVALPLTVDAYVDLSESDVRCLDQFIFRFAKLQDALGAKMFRYALEYMDEDVKDVPMRDVLNKMERYRIIESAEDWNYIRELRNSVSHDYPMVANEEVDTFNALIKKVEALRDVKERLQKWIK